MRARARSPGQGAPLRTSHAAAGDSVAVDEIIAQIETDKVTMDVRAPAAGVSDSERSS